MSDVYGTKCDTCTYCVDIMWPQWACYQWPSGGTLEIAQKWVWCRNCNGVSISEHIHSDLTIGGLCLLAQSADARNDWSANEIVKAKRYSAYPRFRHLHDALEDGKPWDPGKSSTFRNTVELHRFWRSTRGAAERCLRCGDFDFESLKIDDNFIPVPFQHPGCEGTISTAVIRTVRRKRYHWTPEGVAIETGKAFPL